MSHGRIAHSVMGVPLSDTQGDCMGRPPSADPKRAVTLTLPIALLDKAKIKAEARDMSLSAWIAALMRERLKA